MKIFLTGASGFIGQALVRAMRGRGWEVTALIRDSGSEPARWLKAQGVTLASGDVTRREGLREAMAGADVVVHNAGMYEIGTDQALRERMRHVNVQGTDNVLGAALEAGIQRTVHVSSVLVLGASDPKVPSDETKRSDTSSAVPYAQSKIDAHQVALAHREKGLPLVIALPNAVVGVNDHSMLGYFLRVYLLGLMPPVSFARDTVAAVVDVDALAEGLCLAADKAPMGQDYLFCGEPVTFGDILGQFARFPGGMAPRVWVTSGVVRPLMAAMEPVLRTAGVPGFLSRDLVELSLLNINYSSDKARRDLGWQHPRPDEMWPRIIERERELVLQRRGVLNRLKHQSVVS